MQPPSYYRPPPPATPNGISKKNRLAGHDAAVGSETLPTPAERESGMGGKKKRFKEIKERGEKCGTKWLRAAHLEISGSNALNQLHVRTSSASSLGRVLKTHTTFDNRTGFQQAQLRPKERSNPGI